MKGRWHSSWRSATVWVGLMAAVPVQAGHEVTVRASKAALIQTPVTVVLPVSLDASKVVLADTATGQPVAAQADERNGKPALTWIVESLPAGQSKSYRLETGTPHATSPAQGVELERTSKGLDVRIDGTLFTTYQTAAGPKPYCWPMIGPTGRPVTRAFPMQDDVPGEKHDHPHHRSFFFTFDRVNGHDFWSEKPEASQTVHKEFLAVTSGPVFGEFTSRVDWISHQGSKVCEDVRRLRVYRVPAARLFDFEIRLKASEGPVSFGDSKEGLFGFRVAGTMQVDQAPGVPGGTLLNANGDANKNAWGKRAPWCDYYGPLDGQVVGIAIFDRPTNFRHPTYWHARTYGLYAANPFGIMHFTGNKEDDGTHTIPAGGELGFEYRLYIHKGDTQAARVGDLYAAYANPPEVSVR